MSLAGRTKCGVNGKPKEELGRNLPVPSILEDSWKLCDNKFRTLHDSLMVAQQQPQQPQQLQQQQQQQQQQQRQDILFPMQSPATYYRIFNVRPYKTVTTTSLLSTFKSPVYLQTMSSSTPPDTCHQPNSSAPSSSEPQNEASSHATPLPLPLPLPLPEPSSPNTTTIDMSTGGSTVKLDHMGPLVVNKDGTLSRINNWAEMSDLERQNTLRVLGKRNMLRREALEAQGKGVSD
ncbi:hypothetical protein ACEQ8H_002862 [Pleosporales sp. CAS-2024a]